MTQKKEEKPTSGQESKEREIEAAIKEAFKKLGPSIKHYQWEEDGKKYSSWKIDTGNMIINCGDAGMELFNKALIKQALK